MEVERRPRTVVDNGSSTASIENSRIIIRSQDNSGTGIEADLSMDGLKMTGSYTGKTNGCTSFQLAKQ